MKIFCSPNTEDVEQYLRSTFNLKKKTLHIVPTMILYRRRFGFYLSLLLPYLSQEIKEILISNKRDLESSKQIEKELRKYVSIFEMNNFIKEHMLKETSNVLSKVESSVILERVVKSRKETNNISWYSVIPELNQFFIELSMTGLSIENLSLLDNSQKWQQIMDLYTTYCKELENANQLDFGKAAYKILQNLDVSHFDELILDGAFLPITYKHHTIIEKFTKINKPVTVFLPYDVEQKELQPAQKVLETVYGSYVPVSEWTSIQKPRSQSFFINRLPKYIFHRDKQTHLDNSFELLRFSTLESELSYIMQKISVLVRRKEVDPRKIVIITPNAMQLRPMIREVSEQYNLIVDLPKRPIMHLLQGRAIKCLYDLRVDLRRTADTYFDISMFNIICQSALFKHTNRIYHSFNKIESFFVDAFSIREWLKTIDSIIEAKRIITPDKYPHHPLVHIREDELIEIKQLITNIGEISSILLAVPTQTIKEHVNHLLHVLRNDKRLTPIQEELNERLSNICNSLVLQERLPLTSIEFAGRISSLFAEQEDFEPGELAPVEENDNAYIERGILVTGPNNVEYQRYDYVFICRFTQDIYPEPQISNWLLPKKIEQQILVQTTKLPFHNVRDLETFYLDRSLYHIYLAFCAANTQLTISYSELDNGVELTPSHYLHDLGRILGIEEEDRLNNKNSSTLEQLLEHYGILKSPERVEKFDGEHETLITKKTIDEKIISVEDVAIFHYCPRRFYYQKKYPNDNVYRDLFHLQNYAVSCLYEKAVEQMVKIYSKPFHEVIDEKKHQTNIEKNVISFRQAAEGEIHKLFPLSKRVWANVVIQTDHALLTLIKSIFENNYIKEYRKVGNSSIKIQLSLMEQIKEISIEDFKFVATRELSVQYNDRETHRYSISNKKDILSFTSNDMDEREQMEEMKQWYFDFKRQFYRQEKTVLSVIEDMITKIKSGQFPKSPGGHCKYCTYKEICKEREIVL
jgi:ATP-dependent helicase/nuclease subunit B